MISSIQYIYNIYITEFVSFMIILRINDSGLFAWISLTALSRIYLILSTPMICMTFLSFFADDKILKSDTLNIVPRLCYACVLVYFYLCVQMLGIYVLVCARKYVRMYACMYVRVRVIGVKSVNLYVEMLAIGLEKL